MALPSFFVLKSNYNDKYLQYINEDVKVHGLLQFSGEDVSSPFIKYEVVMAECGNGLVHISCCYNNKYWRRWKPNNWWISAGSDEPEEDKSKWSCTLFEPIYVDADAKKVRFRHVQLGHYVCLWRIDPPYGSCLFGGSAEFDENQCDIFTIIDWELILPKNMVFKGDPLPSHFVLQTDHNKKYLRYIKSASVQVHGVLQFSGDEILSPFGKYEVEMAECGNGLVHIRCCYNNKYWVRSSRNDRWIVARANEPDENKTKWCCTLFEPINVDEGKTVDECKTVRFRHVQLQHYACVSRDLNYSYDSCLCVGSKEPDDNELCNVFTITDCKTLLLLPKHIAFKGNNEKFLCPRKKMVHQYLEFASNDIGDPMVGNEVFTNRNGSVRIKSNGLGKFWRLSSSSNWIWADADDSTNDNSVMFWPVKVEGNVIALRNLGNKKYCKRHTTERKMSCLFSWLNKNDNYLTADVPSITSEAKLEVQELVMSREINNVIFRPLDARIYGQTDLIIASQNVTNGNPDPITVTLKLLKTVTKSHTWNASASFKLGVTTKFQTSIPSIALGGIEFSGEFSGAYQWGHAMTESTELGNDCVVTVPPNTTMKATLQATKGWCDVPFSYRQCDTLTNGQQFCYDMDDGIFTGNNFFNLKFETRVEKR